MTDRNAVIMVTGAAGFIGSCMVGYLNQQGYKNIIIIDDFSEADKRQNYIGKEFNLKVERADLFDWLGKNPVKVDFIFHLGARTDTTEFDYSIHEELNVEYSKKIWNYCTEKNIPLVYASSAATYGSARQEEPVLMGTEILGGSMPALSSHAGCRARLDRIEPFPRPLSCRQRSLDGREPVD